jgi:hypothetical protein
MSLIDDILRVAIALQDRRCDFELAPCIALSADGGMGCVALQRLLA